MARKTQKDFTILIFHLCRGAVTAMSSFRVPCRRERVSPARESGKILEGARACFQIPTVREGNPLKGVLPLALSLPKFAQHENGRHQIEGARGRSSPPAGYGAEPRDKGYCSSVISLWKHTPVVSIVLAPFGIQLDASRGWRLARRCCEEHYPWEWCPFLLS